MMKKLVLAGVIAMVLLAGGLNFWAHAIFASDAVRAAVEGQLTRALGQPVRIGRMGATVLPRVTMTLHDVRIGEPAKITAEQLNVGASLAALISRRIEQGSVALAGARVELPLPAFAMGSGIPADAGASAAAPVEIVSIDTLTVDDVEIVSGGRRLTGDVDAAVAGTAVTIRRADFSAEGMRISLTGRIADISGPTGELAISAPSLDALQLVAFLSDFTAGSSTPASRSKGGAAPTAADPRPMDLAVALDAGRATFGTLALDAMKGRARVTDDAVTITPIGFGLFGGRYDGSLALTLSETPGFRLNASVTGVDLAAFTAFTGHPDLVTGRLAGQLDISGRGTTPDGVIASSSGTARIDAVDGSVKGLGLVRAIVLATSMRGDSTAQAAGGSTTEPFTRLGATLAIGRGVATTNDLRFESNDLLLDAAGTIALDASAVNLAGRVQLSDSLSRQAGRDLLRYTREDGRVTLPVAVRGPATALSVSLDTGALLKRAIRNRAEEEVKEAIKKGLGGLFGR
jgi:AsmA protein